jgi:type I restriction enzyme S subunit
MNLPANAREMKESTCFLKREHVNRLGLQLTPAGTILFPKRGGAIATNKKRITVQPSTYDLNTIGLIPVSSVSNYLWHWLSGVDLAQLSDGSNVPQINHDDIDSLSVPLPPLEEQLVICKHLDALAEATECVTLKTGLSRESIRQLDQSILAKAFRGGLIPQDSNDEPATALLDRIRTHKAKEGHSRKTNILHKKKTNSTDPP